MNGFIIAFIIGSLSIVCFRSLPTYQDLVIIFILSISTLLQNRFFTRLSRLIGAFLFGILWVCLYTSIFMPTQIKDRDLGQWRIVCGTVTGLPVLDDRKIRFDFKLNNNTKIKLSWYGHYPKLKPGQDWCLTAKLHRPHSYANPGNVNSGQSLWRQGISALGYVKQNGDNHNLPQQHPWQQSLNFLRYSAVIYIKDKINSHLDASFIQSLLFADKQALSYQNKQLFIDTGTSHLLAISGLHVGMIAGVIYFLSYILWRSSARLCLWLPAPRLAIMLALSAASFYSLLAGFAVSTQRTLLMLSLGVLSLRYFYRINFLQVYLVSLFIIILFNPLEVINPAMWLSYTAVALIFHGSFSLEHETKGLQKWWRLQWVMFIGMMPLSVYYFHKISLLSLIANIIAVPLVSFIILPLAFMIFILMLMPTIIWVTLGQMLIIIFDLTIKLLLKFFILLTQYFSANYYLHFVYTWQALLAMLGIYILSLPKAMPGKLYGLAMLLLCLWPNKLDLNNGEFRFIVFDVGQGLSSLVQTKNHYLLYDTGPRYDNWSAAQAYIMPALRYLYVKKINKLIISHNDKDHSGGLLTLKQSIPIDKIYSSEPKLGQLCHEGLSWHWDGVEFRFLSPVGSMTGSKNNRSCVLKISNQTYSILLTGDIEKQTESLLVRNKKTQLKSEILLVPHHGSKSSSSKLFIEAISPSYAIISVGQTNPYHLPSKTVINQYLSHKIELLSTAIDGAIEFTVGSHKLSGPIRYRTKCHSLWC